MAFNVVTPPNPVAAISASTSPGVGNLQPYNATAGVLAPTLPALSSVADDAWIFVEKDITDTSSNTVTLSRAGSDTFFGGGTQVVMRYPGHRFEILACTVGGTRFWKVVRESIGLAALDLRYDALNAASAAITAQKNAANGLAALDASSKLARSQVPSLPGNPFTAPSGLWQVPQNYISAAPAALTSGLLQLVPFDVGPNAGAYNALGVNVTTAQVGGTTTTSLAIYPDDGSGGRPNLAAGPITAATATLTALANRAAAVTWNPAPGRYWLAFLYVQTAAPSPLPQLSFINSGLAWMPQSTLGTPGLGYTVSGQSALPVTAQTLVIATTVPLIGARAA